MRKGLSRGRWAPLLSGLFDEEKEALNQQTNRNQSAQVLRVRKEQNQTI